MINDKIHVRLIDIDLQLRTLIWPMKDLEYVEQLVFDILDSKGVGPVFRILFGLKVINQTIWLAPNVKLQDLLKSNLCPTTEPNLEVRMRYRPSSLTKLLVLDKRAFEIIFAQIRYDFIHTKFTNEKRDFVLLNDSVLALIATDLLRHALENDIELSDIFRRVKPNDFIPHRASKWQRSLLFVLKEQLDLQKSIQVGSENCRKDVSKVKQAFIEMFLQDVCRDYGSETYGVVCIDNLSNPIPIEIRVRYNQTSTDSFCVIESRVKNSSKSNGWTELCDIYSLCYGTLRDNVVEMDRSNGKPFRISFATNLHAKSFLSLLDGYYRLMRKWHFNFCRDVSSPDLNHLIKIRSHGPIGYETMRSKLSTDKKPGSFLVRRCMDINNRYLIDVLLQSKVRLIIDVDWDPEKRTYIRGNYNCSKEIPLSVIPDNSPNASLKGLINNIQLQMDDDSNYPPIQLKYWLSPSEYDDCPALLLSMSKKKMREFLSKESSVNSINELPKFIPHEMLQFSNKSAISISSKNKMVVRQATINNDRVVIVKDHIDNVAYNCFTSGESSPSKSFFSSIGRKDQSQVKFFNNLKPEQSRLADWMFIKSPLFLETIGLDLTRNSLIQEHLPLGPLDRYLSREASKVKDTDLCLISCQLSQALLFLQEKQVIHGKLRCHNVFIKSLDPIQVKISDPLGAFDVEEDRAFLAPECVGTSGELSVREYVSGIDVWALGTTLWQVYSEGRKPPTKTYANTLIQPSKCTNQIWQLIEACWVVEPSCRVSPQIIYRDLNDSFVWEREVHNYENISQATKSTNSVGEISPPEPPSRESRVSNSGSSSGSGSQLNLLSQRLDAFTSHNSARRVPSSSARCDKTNIYHKRSLTWRSIMPFKNNSLSYSRKSSCNFEHENLNSCHSQMSLSNCSTPPETDALNSTALSDFQDIIDESNVWRIEPSRLRLGGEIGRGTCGVVMKGVLSQWGGLGEQVVAVKCIDNKESGDFSRVDDLKREFEILRNLNHKNIVKTLGYVDDICMKLVVEYMPLGSLLLRLKNSHHDHLLNLPLQKYALDIARGMEYLESKKIVHRDLALRNILVKDENEVKICDFGLAQFLGSLDHYKLKTDRALPLRWYAPEALQNWTFTHKTDVWSYGIVLWEIYSGGSSPQYAGTYADLSETLKHERLLKPKDCPEAMYKLMLSCWEYNPDDRDSFSQICESVEGLPDYSNSSFECSAES